MKPRSPVIIAALLAIAIFCALMAWIYYAKFLLQGRPKTGSYPVEEFRHPQVEHPPDPREDEEWNRRNKDEEQRKFEDIMSWLRSGPMPGTPAPKPR